MVLEIIISKFSCILKMMLEILFLNLNLTVLLSLYTPYLLEGNTEKFNFNIPLLRIIYCICTVTRGGVYNEM